MKGAIIGAIVGAGLGFLIEWAWDLIRCFGPGGGR